MATDVVYVTERPFKSVGIFYPVGTLFDGKEFYDPFKLRLGRCRVSDGYLRPIYKSKGEPYNSNLIKAINRRLSLDLTTAIANKFASGDSYVYGYEYLPPELRVIETEAPTKISKSEVKMAVKEKAKATAKRKVTKRNIVNK